MSTPTENKRWCDFCSCDKEATVEIGYMEDVFVCEEHAESMRNETGYCVTSCMLGYGCDHSC